MLKWRSVCSSLAQDFCITEGKAFPLPPLSKEVQRKRKRTGMLSLRRNIW
jgi:hypothetical protein